METKLKIAVSACLLGDNVRYDGASKSNNAVIKSLSQKFEILRICPEIGIGLSVPRPPIHLQLDNGKIRAKGIQSSKTDYSVALHDFALQVCRTNEDIVAGVFKSRSPSCGINTTPVTAQPMLSNGLFVDELISQLPLIPLVDEHVLEDEFKRDQFFESIVLRIIWRELKTNDEKLNFYKQYAIRYLMRTGKVLTPQIDNGNNTGDSIENRFFTGLRIIVSRQSMHKNLCSNLDSLGCGIQIKQDLLDNLLSNNFEIETFYMLFDQYCKNYTLNSVENWLRFSD